MKKLGIPLVILLAQATPSAAWESTEGGAVARPRETNTTILGISVHCVEGPVIAVYSKDDGPVLPAGDPKATADYFYRPGAVRALVDGKAFPLAAAGSDDAVVLFTEGEEAHSYLAPLDLGLIAAMRGGKSLSLEFDITAAKAGDGTALESFARFDLAGASTAIGAAVKACV